PTFTFEIKRTSMNSDLLSSYIGPPVSSSYEVNYREALSQKPMLKVVMSREELKEFFLKRTTSPLFIGVFRDKNDLGIYSFVSDQGPFIQKNLYRSCGRFFLKQFLEEAILHS